MKGRAFDTQVNIKRDVPLTPSKYFNQKLRNYSLHFVSDLDYIFFAHSVMQKIQLNDQISIAMRTITSNSVNAGMLSNSSKECLIFQSNSAAIHCKR